MVFLSSSGSLVASGRLAVPVGCALTVHVVASVRHVKVGNLAGDCEPGLIPRVATRFRIVVGDLELPDLVVVRAEAPIPSRSLCNHRRRDCPMIAEVDAEQGARTVRVGLIDVVTDQGRIRLRDSGTPECTRAIHIVDVAARMLVPPHGAQGDGPRNERDVHVALTSSASAPFHNPVRADVVASTKLVWIWLIGDDSERAGFARCAVQRALRAGQRLNASDVVQVGVDRAQNRRDRLLVEINADRRQRTRGDQASIGRDSPKDRRCVAR